jgi:hypothetical protein
MWRMSKKTLAENVVLISASSGISEASASGW